MDENFVCECGKSYFLFFWDRVRCTNCWNEYKETTESMNYSSDGDGVVHTERWLRRFNKEKKQYNQNWERSKVTYKNV